MTTNGMTPPPTLPLKTLSASPPIPQSVTAPTPVAIPVPTEVAEGREAETSDGSSDASESLGEEDEDVYLDPECADQYQEWISDSNLLSATERDTDPEGGAFEDEDDSDRLVFFVRAGFRGSPKSASLFWEGDQMVSWQRHDGIKSSVTGLLTGGLSGYAFNHRCVRWDHCRLCC